ncbi:glycosyltransferase [Glycomyces sp. NRRL B-16210]|uniref:glycosyltransferase n=1 Tax=Glycomyces sp. NRRL B-16210 TaxID=1463821 RepID=UPI00042E86F3|nr:glycosyltransferase [Glycomyces sp. NRRL B-16210]AHL24467.1 group 1 glycosyltransferase [Glycomyces sp. NRRL B-16210]
MSPGRRVAVVTPWYPEPQVPFGGSFVRAMVEAVAPGCDRLDVYHLNIWTVLRPAERRRRIWRAQRRLLPRSVPASATVAGAALHRIPVLAPPTEDWRAKSDAFAEWLAVALGGERIEAPIVHAHVPFTAGWAALEHAAPGARVYATEHASFLAEVLAQPRARDRYDAVLDRLDGYFVVGEPLRDLVAAAFPHHAEKIRFIANPVDFRASPAGVPRDLRRWLSVATLTERKRIDHLLRGFALCRNEDPDLTLTLVGDGKERPALEALAAELGVAAAVDFRGAVEPDAVAAIMADHDLLVHTSRHETFGMVVVEAVAAGLPVLVTRSGGPEHALEGIEAACGAFIEVDDDPAVLAEGYADLRGRFPSGLDLARARTRLAARYGHEAVARQHFAAWDAPAPEAVRP